MNREQKFFDALRDLFVGAKIEGESGYINLSCRACEREAPSLKKLADIA